MTAKMSKPMTAAITYLMLKFFMMDGKWGANDVAEGVDYPQTLARFRKRNMTFRLTIFTVVVRAMQSLPPYLLNIAWAWVAQPVYEPLSSTQPSMPMAYELLLIPSRK